MNEIEQLRADIEKLENAIPIAKRLGAQATCATLGALKSEIEFELAKLEAEAAAAADPWADAKKAVKHWEQTIAKCGVQSTNGAVCEYVRHLERHVAELESELAKRPVVYCVRTNYGIATTGSRSKVPRVFLAESIEDEYGDGAQHIVPYTGEQK